MVRRLIVRLMRRCAIGFALLVVATAVAGYLALRHPAFYRERCTQPVTPAQHAAVNREFNDARTAANRWLHASLARQQAAQANRGLLPAGLLAADDYDPRRDVYTVALTESQINVELAGGSTGRRELFRNPRVRIDDDCLELGFEVRPSAKMSVVASFVVEPELTQDGNLRLDIRSARLGVLPIPLHTILRRLPRPIVHSDSKLEVHLAPPAPHITLKLKPQGKQTARIKSLRCTAGTIVVELLPPVLEAAQAQLPQAPPPRFAGAER